MCSCQETPPKYNESQIRNTLLVLLWTQQLEFPQAEQTQQISVRVWVCQQQMRHTVLRVLAAWLLMLQIGKRTSWEVRSDWLIKPSVQFLHSKRILTESRTTHQLRPCPVFHSDALSPFLCSIAIGHLSFKEASCLWKIR